MTRFVIDASAAIDLANGRHRVGGSNIQLFAPELIDLEFANTLRRLVLHGRMDAAVADLHMAAWSRSRLARVSHSRLLPRVWQLRDNLTSYDAAYVALAEHLRIPLITTDRRLARTARQYCEVVEPQNEA